MVNIFLENSVYEPHLGTKTLTRYYDHRGSFNGICYPPTLNIGGVEPEHFKSLLIGIRDVISCGNVFIGMMPSHNLGTTTKLSKTNLTCTMIDYCSQIFA